MNKITNSVAFFLILVAFGVGYWIVSLIFNRMNRQTSGAGNENANNTDNGSEQRRNFRENKAGQAEQPRSSTLDYYCELLELKGDVSVANIRKKYREQQTKYHPDKVCHLGAEFQHMAEKKTREINEAYEFFKQHYNFN